MNNLENFTISPTVKKRKNPLPPNPDTSSNKTVGPGRFPSWLHRKLPEKGSLWQTSALIEKERLHTVCEEAKCPNLLECYTKKTATFLALGSECTRNCGFCDIDHSTTPKPLEDDEPLRIADAVKQLGLKHAVITMVARDDLPDQGASQIARIIRTIRDKNPNTTVEVLTSDFQGSFAAVDKILEASPEIFNHNIETVRSLTPRVRHKATYERTLSILQYIKKTNPSMLTKSGIMVGLGETEDQVKETLMDLKEIGCNIVTIGQYLQPNKRKLRVKAFITPEKFKLYQQYGDDIGISFTYSGPFVRSSYNAGECLEKITT